MFKRWRRNKDDHNSKDNQSSNAFKWDDKASKALDAAVSQSHVPAMLKNKVRGELAKAAEVAATKSGHDTVTPEDLMAGMLEKLPADIRNQVEQAAQQGPDGLTKLKNVTPHSYES